MRIPMTYPGKDAVLAICTAIRLADMGVPYLGGFGTAKTLYHDLSEEEQHRYWGTFRKMAEEKLGFARTP